ncbi:MAG: helix-turn-helix domain-containing protein [Bacteroidales bacterium]|nr:helix-turn-helix domain-containing protein [Bacteroidales bacterium]
MGKRSIIHIKESEEELNKMYKSSRGYKIKKRILSLQFTLANKFDTRLELAKHLGIDVKTLYVWTKLYLEEGIAVMLGSTSGGKRRKVVSDTLRDALDKKLKDSTNPLKGYTDAVIWAKEEHGVDVNYHTIRSFMITNFGCKLKQPRKSHYKKDEVAFEAFKKTSGTT